MLPWQPILGKIGELTFIWHSGIPKQNRISQFRFKNIQWQHFSYILSKFDEHRSSNPEDYEVTNLNLEQYGKYRHISQNISENAGPIVTKFQHS